MNLPVEVVVALIGVFGVLAPIGLKTMFDISKTSKAQRELLELTKKKAIHDQKLEAFQQKREIARDERRIAYDKYDEISKELILSMARSMISGNDVKKLQASVDELEHSKSLYKTAREEYRRVIDDIAQKTLQKDL
jgi:5-bromo-4-chloroindolyl phosphate hydrolysis protein